MCPIPIHFTRCKHLKKRKSALIWGIGISNPVIVWSHNYNTDLWLCVILSSSFWYLIFLHRSQIGHVWYRFMKNDAVWKVAYLQTSRQGKASSVHKPAIGPIDPAAWYSAHSNWCALFNPIDHCTVTGQFSEGQLWTCMVMVLWNYPRVIFFITFESAPGLEICGVLRESI